MGALKKFRIYDKGYTLIDNIKVIGHNYKLIFDSNLVKVDNKLGHCHPNFLEIKIDDSYAQPVQAETLIHEILEALNYALTLNLEHDKICQLSTGLYQVLHDNKEVTDFIKG